MAHIGVEKICTYIKHLWKSFILMNKVVPICLKIYIKTVNFSIVERGFLKYSELRLNIVQFGVRDFLRTVRVFVSSIRTWNFIGVGWLYQQIRANRSRRQHLLCTNGEWCFTYSLVLLANGDTRIFPLQSMQVVGDNTKSRRAVR